MARYHLRKDGMPGECQAQPGRCPLGGEESHFADKLAALAAAEEKLREENDYLASTKRAPVYHVGVSGAVEECSLRDGYCDVQPFGKFTNVHSSDKSIVTGAARAYRETQGATPPAPKPPTPKATPSIAEDPVTAQARDTLRSGLSSWDQERLNKGWTLEEVQKSRDSCGHWVPPRFAPKPSGGWSC